MISAANMKGGVGKTTTVLSLGFCLAMTGCRVLLVDADPGGSLTAQLAEENSFPLSSFLKGKPALSEIFKPACAEENLFSIVSDRKLASIERRLLSGEKIKLFLLKKRLASLKDKFDFILVDTPPSFSGLTLNALFAADLIVIPVQPEFTVFHGLSRMIDAVRLVDRYRNNKSKYQILLAMYDRKADKRKKYLSIIEKRFSRFLFKTVIENDPNIKIASNLGEPFIRCFPESAGAVQYRLLADEILSLKD